MFNLIHNKNFSLGVKLRWWKRSLFAFSTPCWEGRFFTWQISLFIVEWQYAN